MKAARTDPSPRPPADGGNAVTATGLTRQQPRTATADVGGQFALLRYVLLAFGAIALFVGSFIIFNTLSITVAQRTRELATLRALGASRRQVLASILAEVTIVGGASSVVGLGAGVGFAKGLGALLGASGIQLPAAGTVFTWRTAAISLTAGIAITLAASAAPALRAMRIAPIAAIREGSAPRPESRLRGLTVTAVAVVLGAGALVPVVVLGGLPAASRLVLLAGGALVLFIGVASASRWIVGPLAAAIEKPIEPFTRGTGELAREDTMRNPARTATTAAAPPSSTTRPKRCSTSSPAPLCISASASTPNVSPTSSWWPSWPPPAASLSRSPCAGSSCRSRLP